MDLDELDAKPHDMFHVGQNILRVARVHAAAGDKPLRIFLHVVGDELIDRRREADHLGCNVVDEHRPVDANSVEMLEKCLWGAAVFGHLIEVLARLLHQRQGLRLEQLHRLNVDVAVGDEHRLSVVSYCINLCGISLPQRSAPLAWRTPAPSRGDTLASAPRWSEAWPY